MSTKTTKAMDNQAIAAYVEDMLSGLITLAYRGQMVTLMYLLGVARLEAKNVAAECRRDNVRAPQRHVSDGKQGVKMVGVKGAQPHHEATATEIAVKGTRRPALNTALGHRQLTRFAKPDRGVSAHPIDGRR
jgi:hypothetical protein